MTLLWQPLMSKQSSLNLSTSQESRVAPEMTQPREMTHPRTKVVLQSRQFSASSSPDTPRTKVALQSRQFSFSSSPDTPRTKVVLQCRQLSA